MKVPQRRYDTCLQRTVKQDFFVFFQTTASGKEKNSCCQQKKVNINKKAISNGVDVIKNKVPWYRYFCNVLLCRWYDLPEVICFGRQAKEGPLVHCHRASSSTFSHRWTKICEDKTSRFGRKDSPSVRRTTSGDKRSSPCMFSIHKYLK